MRAKAITRIRVLTGVVLLVALILIVRLYHIQIMNGHEYRERGEAQYVHTVRDLYNRGSVYFTTKEGEAVSAATVQSGFLLAIDPTRIDNAEYAYNAINNIVPIDKGRFTERAARTNRTYQEIAGRILRSEAEQIEALELPGVRLYRNQWRYYPGDALGARTVGFVGYQGDELSGRYGIERYYNDVLVRSDERLSVNFFAEIFSNIGEFVFDTTDAREGDVITTLEPTVMRTLERELFETNEEWNSAVTGGIVMDPKTGEIFALSAVPSFNLNDRSGAVIEDFQNPLVENVYELGSIIKALTVAAGLDSKVITAASTYYDAGSLELDTLTISNFDGKGRGLVNMQEVLNQSLNTGVAHIVSTMGKDLFREYFLNLKIGSESGIDLPNEASGLIDNLYSPRDIEYATASFGQGIAMTPIAATRALSALANGGVLVTPHIVSRIEYNDGSKKDITYPEGDRVFSEETSEEISRMLTVVVDDALRGGAVSLPQYSVAAKTWTAQIAGSDGRYAEDRFLHSFFGYFPSYEPRFIIFLYTVEPKDVRYASETLTEPFMDMTRFLINYYNIPPDR